MPGESDGGLRFREGWLQRGFTQIPNVVLHRPDISVGGKVLYAMLVSYAWKDDHCWAGQDTLARELAASERSVRNWLAELRELRILTVEHRGLMQTNVYWLEPLDHLAGPEENERFRTDRQNLPPAAATVAGQDRHQVPPMKGGCEGRCHQPQTSAQTGKRPMTCSYSSCASSRASRE